MTTAPDVPGPDEIRETSRLQLSHGQEALWFLQQLHPQSPIYTEAWSMRIADRVAAPVLERSLNELVRRHDILRTRFEAEGGRPLQVTLPAAELKLRVEDLTCLPAAERHAAMARLIDGETAQVFDLATAPLLRALLVRVAEGESVLVFSMHHIVCDGLAAAIFACELQAIYTAYAAGQPSSLAELPLQFPAHAASERRRSEQRAHDNLRYWERLLGDAPVTALGTDRPRPPVQSFRGASETVRISDSVAAAVDAFAARENATPFMVYLAAFQILLHRYTGESDIVTGAPIADRPSAEADRMIGMFVNMTLFRIDLSGDPSAAEAVARVREAVIEAFAHLVMPFERLVKSLRPQRDLSRNPLFQIAFAYERRPTSPQAAASAWSARPVAGRAAKFDLTLIVEDEPEGRHATMEYCTDLFKHDTIRRLIHHYQSLLEAIGSEPATRISELLMLSEPELHRLLVEWNSSGAGYPRQSTVHGLFREQARRAPDAVALVDRDDHLTYREVDRRSDWLAGRLAAVGIGPEDTVGIALPRSADFVISILGALKAGAAYLPIDPEFPDERRQHLLADSRAAALIVAGDLGVPKEFAGAVILLDAQALAGAPGSRTPAPLAPDNLACVIYTSGSTGLPKGVAITHRGICRMVFDPGNGAVGRSDTMSQLSPVAFDASTFEIWAALLRGARLVILHRDIVLSAAALRAEIERQQFSVMFLTSALFHEMSRLDPAIVSGVATVLVGGETADTEAFRRVLQAGPPGRLLHMYGPAEAVTFASRFPVAEVPAEAASIPIGRPVANIGLYILDRNQHPVPLGAIGELYVAGDCLARGYLRRPDLTAERFVPDLFGNEPGGRMYRTGDRARYLPDGTIEFFGRLDNQVKLRGFRIEPGEIESVLLRHPHVAEAAVVAWRRDAGRHVLTAYIAPAGRRPEAGELRRFLQAKLPDYMVPSIVVLDRLPRNANGKLDRAALPEPRLVEDGDAGDAPPRTPTERTLSRIWAEVLGLEGVGLHHNFFAIGGDSILAIQVVARAAAAGLSVTPQMIFQNQTIATLATVCEASVGTVSASVSGPTVLTPVQQWFFERCPADAHHFNQAVCLELQQPGSADTIRRALASVAGRHAVLRCRFEERAGSWSQRVADDEAAWPLQAIDLSDMDAAHVEATYLAHAVAIGGSLDLARGPLARAALFDLGAGRPARLLLVIHHLVVDAVSWQIVLQDLDAACISERQGRPTAPLPATTPFQLWARRLREYADSAELRDQLRYWTSLSGAPAPLPVDGQWGENDEASARTVTLQLSVAETEALLRQLPKAYRTRVADGLLAGLMLVMTRWTGEGALLIDVEGHGREPLFGDVDLSRTVGWFTSLFPVRLDLGGVAAAPGEVLIAVKEQMRAIPARGIGFGLLRYLCSDAEVRDRLAATPRPEIAFNYLGQRDGLLRDSELFRTTALDTGPHASLRQKRTHLLAVDAIVTGRRLRVDWTFSANRHRPETIEQLAHDMGDGLRAIIRHCGTAGAFTPADFPLARLDSAALDGLWRLDPSIEDVYPLSPLQKGMLFHTLYAPDSGAYVEQYAFTLDGEMDSEALRRAWNHAALRFSILRTWFLWEGLEEPVQVVRPFSPVVWEQQDWRDLDEARRRDRLLAFLRRDRARGFELFAAPPMRLALLRTGDREHQLVWSFHHALLDGWSVSLVLRDVFACYEAFRLDREPALEPAPRWRDYIEWLGGQNRASEEQFWRGYLSGFVAPTPLPLAKPDAAGAAETYREAATCLAQDVTARLDALIRQRGLTWNTVIHGLWAVLLNRCTGDTDVMFGSTVSGRPAALPGVERTVGMFLNTVPVRLRVVNARAAIDWLQDVQRDLAEVRQHQHVSLVDAQEWSDLPPSLPLINSILVFENYPVDPLLRGAGESLRIVRATPYEQTTYPLSIFAVPGQVLRISAVFDERCYGQPVVDRLLGQLRAMLEDIARRPDRSLGELCVLTEPEYRRVLAWSSHPDRHGPPGYAHELFEIHAELTPEAIAVEHEDGALSYRELNDAANRLAQRLASLGVAADVRVGICLGRSPDMVVALLAVLKAGGCFVPLDPRHPVDRLRFMMEDAEVAVVVTNLSLRGLTATHGGHVVDIDDRAHYGRDDVGNLSRGSTPADLAYIIYTSGSTGRPKGVLLHHRGLANLVAAQIAEFGCTGRSRVLQFARLSFDAAVSEIFVTLGSGATLVLASEDAMLPGAPLAECLRRASISLVTLPPSVLQAIPPGTDLPGLETVVSAGEACPADVVRRWSATHRFLNAYGPTEITVCATIDGSADPATASIGRPIRGARLYVLTHSLQMQPPGAVGELYVGGEGVARGYLNRPGLTAEMFLPNPFSDVPGDRLYRTGDLGRWLDDGRIEFVGRRDRQVKLRGFRIELGEVEAVLRRQSGVREAAVVVHEDGGGNKRLVGYVVPEPSALAGHDGRGLSDGMHAASPGRGEADARSERAATGRPSFPASATLDRSELSLDALRGALRSALPDYMVPAQLVSIDTMPRTASGKVDRKGLPAPDRVCATHREFSARPPSPLEEILCAIWADVLNRDGVTSTDNFFELGGHSLNATRVMLRLREALQVEVPLRMLFEHPTVEDLARCLASHTGTAPPPGLPIVTVPRTGGVPVSFAQERLWFVHEYEAGASNYNCPIVLEISGALDRAALGRALDEIVGRHEILRTRFPSVDGVPIQVISPRTGLPLVVIDAGDGELARIMAEEFARPFDLKNGPVIRAKLIRMSEHRHRLLLAMHHIVWDGWSVGVLCDELAEFYEAFSLSRSPRLPDLPIQYADFAAWQRSGAQGLARDADLGYWRRLLRGCRTTVQLPFDRARPQQPSHAGAYLTALLPQELAGDLRRLTRRRGLTPFMVLLAGFETLLHRLSGQEEFAVGVAAIGRGRVEIERLIGLFLNMLVLRADLSGDPTFAQVLERVRDASLDAFAHQDIPLERLVEAVAPNRGNSAAPLFEVAFGFDRPPPSELRAGNVEMKLLDAEVTTARYDLTLWVREQSDRLEATWTYSTDLFDAETIQRMHRQFETLLGAAVSAPETCITDLELRTAAELKRDTVEQRNREDSRHQRLLRATPRVVSAASLSAE